MNSIDHRYQRLRAQANAERAQRAAAAATPEAKRRARAAAAERRAKRDRERRALWKRWLADPDMPDPFA